MFKILKKDSYCNYKGLRIMANPDLHKKVANEIRKLNLNKNIKIVVLASGTGAFDKRLLDMGFKNITSIDIEKDNYKLNSKYVDFMELDLNKDFYNVIAKRFDLVLCLEIIEHVYNPFSFVSNCKKLLEKDGIFIISTPNVHDYFSRVHFFLFGYPILFINSPEKYGHISPIFKNIFEHYLLLNNMKIVKLISVSNFFKYLQIYTCKSYIYYLIIFILSILLFPLRFFLQEKNNGLISIYLIKNN